MCGLLITLDTVWRDTFACSATVAIVTFSAIKHLLRGLNVQGRKCIIGSFKLLGCFALYRRHHGSVKMAPTLWGEFRARPPPSAAAPRSDVDSSGTGECPLRTVRANPGNRGAG